MSNIDTSNRISPFVSSHLPEFVKIDHPTFVAFLNAYYEWLETEESALLSPMALNKVGDIDQSFDIFVKQFKSQYLLDFPETLAINGDTQQPVEVRTLVKRIKSFYKAKGTEKAYEFLFRILYDTNVEFYYPKVDLLKVSDGKWIQKKALRVSSTQGNKLFESVGRKIYQRNLSGVIIATASIIDLTRFQQGVFGITELNLGNINGSFSTLYKIELETSTGIVYEPKVYSVVSSISISSGGSNYRVGDRLVFTNASGDIGQGAKAKVSQVNSSGKILKLKIENFGANYLTAPTVSVSSNKGSGFSGTASIGAICNFEGYYANSDGKLSSNKVIQDSHYYQDFSYVLKTEITIDKYKEIIKRLIHPAGIGFFGQILIKRCSEAQLHVCNSLIRYEVPLIGHYAPYTALTFDDLNLWFMSGGTAQGYDPTTQDATLTNYPNPITYAIDFVAAGAGVLFEAGFPRADPFWIIYHHPNTRINTVNIARIEKDLVGFGNVDYISIGRPISITGYNAGKDDFLNGSTGSTGWKEWTMQGITERSAWSTSFTGDFKYALLQYDTTTPFRKITMGSFFNMPIGDEYVCYSEDGIGATHPNSPNF